MTGYVVDASVVVKWLVAEEWSDESSRLLETRVTLIAPELVFAEASNALWAMHRRGDLTRDDLADATDLLKSAPVSVPVSMRRLTAGAVRLAVDLGHPAYDCYYLALALQEQYPVITADVRFHDRVRGHPYLSDRIVHVARASANPPNPL